MLPDDFVDQLKSAYPKRLGGQGWADVARLVPKAIAQGSTWNEILSGVIAYSKLCAHQGKTGTELVKQARTFFGPGQWWAEDYEVPKTPQQLRIEARWAGLHQRAAASGFTRYSPNDPRIPIDVFESALVDHERAKKRDTSGVVTQLTRGMK